MFSLYHSRTTSCHQVFPEWQRKCVKTAADLASICWESPRINTFPLPFRKYLMTWGFLALQTIPDSTLSVV